MYMYNQVQKKLKKEKTERPSLKFIHLKLRRKKEKTVKYERKKDSERNRSKKSLCLHT